LFFCSAIFLLLFLYFFISYYFYTLFLFNIQNRAHKITHFIGYSEIYFKLFSFLSLKSSNFAEKLSE